MRRLGHTRTGYFYRSTDQRRLYNRERGRRRAPVHNTNDVFNYGPYNFFQVPQTQYSANVFAHYDALPNVRAYAEFDFSQTQTTLQVAPGGDFFSQQYPMNNDNPLLSQAFKDAFGITAGTPQQIYIARRNVEGGGRTQEITLSDWRYVLGAKGDLFDSTWNWNAWWQSGRNTRDNFYGNYFSVKKTCQGGQRCHRPERRAGVRVRCRRHRSVLRSVGRLPPDGVTQAALNYLNTPGFSNGFTSQSVIGLQVDSDLGAAYGWRTPWAKNGAAVAFGYERRVEKLVFKVDDALLSGDLSGFGGASPGNAGQYTVNEGYFEGRLPIMEQRDWAYLLSINGAYRYSNYSTNFSTNTYGIGAEWAPVKDYKFRGTYQQAVRAPNIVELLLPASTNLFNMYADPCAGPNPIASLAGCLASGLPTEGLRDYRSLQSCGPVQHLDGRQHQPATGDRTHLHGRPRHAAARELERHDRLLEHRPQGRDRGQLRQLHCQPVHIQWRVVRQGSSRSDQRHAVARHHRVG